MAEKWQISCPAWRGLTQSRLCEWMKQKALSFHQVDKRPDANWAFIEFSSEEQRQDFSKKVKNLFYCREALLLQQQEPKKKTKPPSSSHNIESPVVPAKKKGKVRNSPAQPFSAQPTGLSILPVGVAAATQDEEIFTERPTRRTGSEKKDCSPLSTTTIAAAATSDTQQRRTAHKGGTTAFSPEEDKHISAVTEKEKEEKDEAAGGGDKGRVLLRHGAGPIGSSNRKRGAQAAKDRAGKVDWGDGSTGGKRKVDALKKGSRRTESPAAAAAKKGRAEAEETGIEVEFPVVEEEEEGEEGALLVGSRGNSHEEEEGGGGGVQSSPQDSPNLSPDRLFLAPIGETRGAGRAGLAGASGTGLSSAALVFSAAVGPAQKCGGSAPGPGEAGNNYLASLAPAGDSALSRAGGLTAERYGSATGLGRSRECGCSETLPLLGKRHKLLSQQQQQPVNCAAEKTILPPDASLSDNDVGEAKRSLSSAAAAPAADVRSAATRSTRAADGRAAATTVGAALPAMTHDFSGELAKTAKAASDASGHMIVAERTAAADGQVTEEELRKKSGCMGSSSNKTQAWAANPREKTLQLPSLASLIEAQRRQQQLRRWKADAGAADLAAENVAIRSTPLMQFSYPDQLKMKMNYVMSCIRKLTKGVYMEAKKHAESTLHAESLSSNSLLLNDQQLKPQQLQHKTEEKKQSAQVEQKNSEEGRIPWYDPQVAKRWNGCPVYGPVGASCSGRVGYRNKCEFTIGYNCVVSEDYDEKLQQQRLCVLEDAARRQQLLPHLHRKPLNFLVDAVASSPHQRSHSFTPHLPQYLSSQAAPSSAVFFVGASLPNQSKSRSRKQSFSASLQEDANAAAQNLASPLIHTTPGATSAKHNNTQTKSPLSSNGCCAPAAAEVGAATVLSKQPKQTCSPKPTQAQLSKSLLDTQFAKSVDTEKLAEPVDTKKLSETVDTKKLSETVDTGLSAATVERNLLETAKTQHTETLGTGGAEATKTEVKETKAVVAFGAATKSSAGEAGTVVEGGAAQTAATAAIADAIGTETPGKKDGEEEEEEVRTAVVADVVKEEAPEVTIDDKNNRSSRNQGNRRNRKSSTMSSSTPSSWASDASARVCVGFVSSVQRMQPIVAPVSGSLLVSHAMQEVCAKLQTVIHQSPFSVYNRQSHKGTWRLLRVRASESQKELLLLLQINPLFHNSPSNITSTAGSTITSSEKDIISLTAASTTATTPTATTSAAATSTTATNAAAFSTTATNAAFSSTPATTAAASITGTCKCCPFCLTPTAMTESKTGFCSILSRNTNSGTSDYGGDEFFNTEEREGYETAAALAAFENSDVYRAKSCCWRVCAKSLIRAFAQKTFDGYVVKSIFIQESSAASDSVEPAYPTYKVWGQDFITHRVLGLDFRVGPHTFFQTNTHMCPLLFSAAITLAFSASASSCIPLVDVCCGTGAIALCAAAAAAQLKLKQLPQIPSSQPPPPASLITASPPRPSASAVSPTPSPQPSPPPPSSAPSSPSPPLLPASAVSPQASPPPSSQPPSPPPPPLPTSPSIAPLPLPPSIAPSLPPPSSVAPPLPLPPSVAPQPSPPPSVSPPLPLPPSVAPQPSAPPPSSVSPPLIQLSSVSPPLQPSSVTPPLQLPSVAPLLPPSSVAPPSVSPPLQPSPPVAPPSTPPSVAPPSEPSSVGPPSVSPPLIQLPSVSPQFLTPSSMTPPSVSPPLLTPSSVTPQSVSPPLQPSPPRRPLAAAAAPPVCAANPLLEISLPTIAPTAVATAFPVETTPIAFTKAEAVFEASSASVGVGASSASVVGAATQIKTESCGIWRSSQIAERLDLNTTTGVSSNSSSSSNSSRRSTRLRDSNNLISSSSERSTRSENREEAASGCPTGTGSSKKEKKVVFTPPQQRGVIGIEVVEEAVKHACENAILNHLENDVLFVCGKAEVDLPRILQEHFRDCKEIAAIVDPPRAGLHRKALRALLDFQPIKRVVYVSCSPSSLVENCIQLCTPTAENRDPFVPVCALPVDMFPHTFHCEMVLLLVRASAAAHCKEELSRRAASLFSAPPYTTH